MGEEIELWLKEYLDNKGNYDKTYMKLWPIV